MPALSQLIELFGAASKIIAPVEHLSSTSFLSSFRVSSSSKPRKPRAKKEEWDEARFLDEEDFLLSFSTRVSTRAKKKEERGSIFE